MLNKVILMGRLTADPQLRYTPNSVAVCSFRLAVDRNYARPGEQKLTDFIDIVCWRNTAEFVSKYFRKGQLVALSGSLQTRSWKDNYNQNRTSYEVVADEVYFAEPKRDNTVQPEPEIPAFTPSEDSTFHEIDEDDELPF